MNVIPVMLCRNEEVWIRRVLSALTAVFPHVVVADTGSTDNTISEIEQVAGVHLMRFGNLSPKDIGLCRGWMQASAKDLFGATHVMLVDADELYPISYLRYIHDHSMPENALSGFTSGVEVTELENGELWFLGDSKNSNAIVGLNRQAIFSVDAKWHGEYPFESPDCYVPSDPSNFYFAAPGRIREFRFFHLHQTTRSRHDDVVYMRRQKKYQFGLRDAPWIVPSEFWLKSEKDYQDA
jgi:glycosyltransferase involved in cell wall biosynthesis